MSPSSAAMQKISPEAGKNAASKIKKAAVFGSGVMGAAIAANIANSGTPVILFDIVPNGAPASGEDRNQLAKSAIEKMLSVDPSPFTHPDNAKLVTPANIEDHLNLLGDVDWIIEAVIEKLPIKHDVYKKIDANRKPGSVVSSNTSTIPLNKLVEGMGEQFAKDFVIAHFFNPPRFLRLLELVSGSKTSPSTLDSVREFCDVMLGKGVIPCKDTPGFIGNRIGCYWLQVGLNEAINLGLTVEEADAIMGKPVGIPRTAVFGLYDLIGIDLMLLIGKELTAMLPKTDDYCVQHKVPEMITSMVADGYTGRKGKGGFTRMNKTADGKKVFEVKDLQTGEYREQGKAELESVKAAKAGLHALVTHPDKGGQYAWAVLSKVLSYTASLVGEISDSVSDIDEAMKTGYGWDMGPFEMIDKLAPQNANNDGSVSGAKWFADKLKAEGSKVPAILEKIGNGSFYKTEGGVASVFSIAGKYQAITADEGSWTLSDIKLSAKPIFTSKSANIWDVGHGIACLEITTKMNAVDEGVLDAFEEALKIVPKQFKGMIIGNDAGNFSVGANLNFFLTNAQGKTWQPIDDLIARGQRVFMDVKYSNFPVVSALAGMALGGGCEIVLHSNHVQAHIESYAGLVEIGVGVIPGWGGCKETLIRYYNATGGNAQEAARLAFEQIASARMSKSAQDARSMLTLGSCCGISMNRLRLLADAKALCLGSVSSYKPASEAKLKMNGVAIKKMLETMAEGIVNAGKGSPHDLVVMKHLADVLSGGGKDGEVTERELLELERKNFMAVIKTEPSIARIEHMLNTGKPLKN